MSASPFEVGEAVRLTSPYDDEPCIVEFRGLTADGDAHVLMLRMGLTVPVAWLSKVEVREPDFDTPMAEQIDGE